MREKQIDNGAIVIKLENSFLFLGLISFPLVYSK